MKKIPCTTSPSALLSCAVSAAEIQGQIHGGVAGETVTTQTFRAGTVIQGFLLVRGKKKQFEEAASSRLYTLLHPKAVVVLEVYSDPP